MIFGLYRNYKFLEPNTVLVFEIFTLVITNANRVPTSRLQDFNSRLYFNDTSFITMPATYNTMITPYFSRQSASFYTVRVVARGVKLHQLHAIHICVDCHCSNDYYKPTLVPQYCGWYCCRCRCCTSGPCCCCCMASICCRMRCCCVICPYCGPGAPAGMPRGQGGAGPPMPPIVTFGACCGLEQCENDVRQKKLMCFVYSNSFVTSNLVKKVIFV